MEAVLKICWEIGLGFRNRVSGNMAVLWVEWKWIQMSSASQGAGSWPPGCFLV